MQTLRSFSEFTCASRATGVGVFASARVYRSLVAEPLQPCQEFVSPLPSTLSKRVKLTSERRSVGAISTTVQTCGHVLTTDTRQKLSSFRCRGNAPSFVHVSLRSRAKNVSNWTPSARTAENNDRYYRSRSYERFTNYGNPLEHVLQRVRRIVFPGIVVVPSLEHVADNLPNESSLVSFASSVRPILRSIDTLCSFGRDCLRDKYLLRLARTRNVSVNVYPRNVYIEELPNVRRATKL